MADDDDAIAQAGLEVAQLLEQMVPGADAVRKAMYLDRVFRGTKAYCKSNRAVSKHMQWDARRKGATAQTREKRKESLLHYSGPDDATYALIMERGSDWTGDGRRFWYEWATRRASPCIGHVDLQLVTQYLQAKSDEP